MAVLNKRGADNKSYNVGFGRNFKEFAPVIGVIPVPKGTFLSQADINTIQTTLNARALNDNPLLRSMVIGTFIEFTEAGADPKKESLPNGVELILANGIPVFTGTLRDGGFNMHLNLLNYKNAHTLYDFLFIHSDQTIGGTWRTVSGAKVLYGISMSQVWTLDRQFATISASEKTRLVLAVRNPMDLNENYGYVECDFDVLGTIPTITNVDLEIANSAAGTLTVKAYEKFTKVDLRDYFSSELTGTTKFVFFNETTGAAMPISACIAVAGGWKATPTSAPTSGDIISVKLAAPSVLIGASVFTPGQGTYESPVKAQGAFT